MDNRDRLLLEMKGFNESDEVIGEIDVRLEESGLQAEVLYDATSNTNLKQIYQTALSILESIANDPTNFKNYKTEDITVSMFSKNLQNRIDYLNRKIRMMPDDDDYDSNGGATVGYLFTE